VTVEGDSIVRNEALYAMAHFSRFVPSGSVRVASTETTSLHDVAFRTPTGETVLIVANPGKTAIAFRVRMKEKSFPATLAPDAVVTYRW
jgi:glucosylceramidase